MLKNTNVFGIHPWVYLKRTNLVLHLRTFGQVGREVGNLLTVLFFNQIARTYYLFIVVNSNNLDSLFRLQQDILLLANQDRNSKRFTLLHMFKARGDD